MNVSPENRLPSSIEGMLGRGAQQSSCGLYSQRFASQTLRLSNHPIFIHAGAARGMRDSLLNGFPSSIEEGMLGRGPSRGGCRLSPSASIRSYWFRTTPAAAAGCCLPHLVQGGERRNFHPRRCRPCGIRGESPPWRSGTTNSPIVGTAAALLDRAAAGRGRHCSRRWHRLPGHSPATADGLTFAQDYCLSFHYNF